MFEYCQEISKFTLKMSQIEVKAQKLRDEAVKKRNANGFFKTLFSKSNDTIDESIEYYARAANLFKMAKNWSQAGHAFSDAAELSLQNESQPEAAVYFIEAANCFKKCDTSKAIELYQSAIAIYRDKGKYSSAGKYHQVIAEILEDEYDIQEAVEHFERATEYYKQECNFSCANKCLEKIAEYSALSEDYDKVRFLSPTLNIDSP
nr:alpha-soluble NSF attachment protein [Leptinotarsa decemlineata]